MRPRGGGIFYEGMAWAPLPVTKKDEKWYPGCPSRCARKTSFGNRTFTRQKKIAGNDRA